MVAEAEAAAEAAKVAAMTAKAAQSTQLQCSELELELAKSDGPVPPDQAPARSPSRHSCQLCCRDSNTLGPDDRSDLLLQLIRPAACFATDGGSQVCRAGPPHRCLLSPPGPTSSPSLPPTLPFPPQLPLGPRRHPLQPAGINSFSTSLDSSWRAGRILGHLRAPSAHTDDYEARRLNPPPPTSPGPSRPSPPPSLTPHHLPVHRGPTGRRTPHPRT